jgi:hypothetical protein
MNLIRNLTKMLAALAVFGLLAATGQAAIVVINPGNGVFSGALGSLSPGDELHLNPGTYAEGASSTGALSIPADVRILGLGATPQETVIMRVNSRQVIAGGLRNGAGPRAELENVTLVRAGSNSGDQAAAEIHSSMFNIDAINCIFDGEHYNYDDLMVNSPPVFTPTGAGKVGQGVFAGNSTMTNCEVRNLLNRGIRIDDADNDGITDCLIEDISGHGIEIANNSFSATVTGTAITTCTSNGVDVPSSGTLILTGGAISACGGHGIDNEGLADIDGAAVISNNAGSGVLFLGGSTQNSTIDNCTVADNVLAGVKIQNTSLCTVGGTGNTVENNGTGPSNYFDNTGVGLVSSSSITVSNNTITNNGIGSSGSSNVLLRNANGAIVSGNTITAGGQGFFCLDGGAVTIENNTIANHSRKGVQQEASGGDITSTGNCIFGNGIGLRAEGNSIVSRNDTIWGNGYYGVRADGSSTVDIQDGIIAGNTGDGLSAGTGTVTSDFNDVVGNGTDYNGATPGANDISVDPVFASTTAGDSCFLHLTGCTIGGTPNAVMTGTSANGIQGAKPVCGALSCTCCDDLMTAFVDDVCDSISANPPTSIDELQAVVEALAETPVAAENNLCGDSATCISGLVNGILQE